MIFVSHLERDNESTVYAHLDGFNCGLGQLVAGGEVIGFVGNSCSPPGAVVPAWCRGMGTHLHFEVHNSRVPQMGALRDNVALGRREVQEPETWLAAAGIRVVGETT
jgi:murein DD-endopeptidase MepM/ murein hydrolase activator NlpD